MPRSSLAALVVVLALLPGLAQAEPDSTGYRWFGCEAGLALGGVGLALTLPHVVEPRSDDPNRQESSGASVFAAMGLSALALGMCPAGLFASGALAESLEADEDLGYGLAGGGLSALGGTMLGYGLGMALDASPGERAIAASVGGALGAVGGFLVGGRVGAEGEVYDDRKQGPLFAFGGLFVLTGLVTALVVGLTSDADSPPSSAMLLAPSLAGLGGFYLVGALSR